jgi:hypothetical protein
VKGSFNRGLYVDDRWITFYMGGVCTWGVEIADFDQ